MTQFMMRSQPFEGYQLVGDPSNIEMVMNWIVSYGLPKLIDPNPDLPFSGVRMVNSKGERFTPGIYIDPNKGTLIIRNMYRAVLEADYGDWVMRDVVNSNFIVAKTPTVGTLYIPV